MPRSTAPTASAPAGSTSEGVAHEEEIDGLLAVCLQHEMDHLEGMLFIDHLSRLKREMILRKIAKARREQRQEGGLTGHLLHSRIPQRLALERVDRAQLL